MIPQPLTPDLLEIASAWRAGIASNRAGFAQGSNPYSYRYFRDSEERLKAWAFDLGWRESERLMERRQAKGAA